MESIQIKLIKSTYSTDSIGQSVPTFTERTIFGYSYPITRQEWQSAGERGLKPEFMCKVFSYDYEGEEICEISSVKYGIYRVYKNGDVTELYMEKKVGL